MKAADDTTTTPKTRASVAMFRSIRTSGRWSTPCAAPAASFPSRAPATSRVALRSSGSTWRPPVSTATTCQRAPPACGRSNFRSFRTTFATFCALSGFDSAWIDAWLGHAAKTTAAKHYVKATGQLTAGVFPALAEDLLIRTDARDGRPVGQDGDQLTETIVRRTGLEPVRFYSLVPETSASANSATFAGEMGAPY